MASSSATKNVVQLQETFRILHLSSECDKHMKRFDTPSPLALTCPAGTLLSPVTLTPSNRGRWLEGPGSAAGFGGGAAIRPASRLTPMPLSNPSHPPATSAWRGQIHDHEHQLAWKTIKGRLPPID